MSATVIEEKRRTSLPADVSEAAGLKPGDRVEWRYEDGEIRGRKIAAQERRIVGKLVRKGDALVCDTDGLTIAPEDIARAVREERDR